MFDIFLSNLWNNFYFDAGSRLMALHPAAAVPAPVRHLRLPGAPADRCLKDGSPRCILGDIRYGDPAGLTHKVNKKTSYFGSVFIANFLLNCIDRGIRKMRLNIFFLSDPSASSASTTSAWPSSQHTPY